MVRRARYWVPIVLSILVLARLSIHRTSPGRVRESHLSSRASERHFVPSAFPVTAHSAEWLREALLSHDLARIESAFRDLISEQGDRIYPEIIRVLLSLDSASDDAVLVIIARNGNVQSVTNALLFEISEIGWLSASKAQRRNYRAVSLNLLRLLSSSGGDARTAALLLKQYDQARSPEGRVALACLGVRLKMEGWVRRLRTVLASIKDPEIREDAFQAIAESREPEGIRFLLSLIDTSKHGPSESWDMAQAIVQVLPAEETLSFLLSAGKADEEFSDVFPISFIVSGIVEREPHGLQIIKDGWKNVITDERKSAIVMGLGELKTRQDISLFLQDIAQSEEPVSVRGTALINAGRLVVDTVDTYALASRLAFFKDPNPEKQWDMRTSAILAMENMYTQGQFSSDIRDVFRSVLESETDPIVLEACIRAASKQRIVELRNAIQKLALENVDPRVRMAASKYLER